MRILYLHQYFATPQSSGGTRSYEFARRLIAKGHDVRVITSPGYLPEQYRKLDKTTTVEFDGIPVTIIPVPYGNKMSFPRRIRAFISFACRASLEAMKHKPDLIFATSTPLTIAIPGILAKLRRRRPMVFEVRDLWPEVPVAIGALRNPLFRWGASLLEWLAYHSSRHIVALSPGMAEGVQRRGISADRVSVIPNISNLSAFEVPAQQGDAIRTRLGIGPDTPLVVYTGTLGFINGVSYMAELAHAMLQVDPEIRFLVVGDGIEREKVTARAEALGVTGKNLTFWEPVRKEQLPEILAAATVATSWVIDMEVLWHNSANKFFDAMAAGKPFVINHLGWQADLLQESGAGVALPPADYEEAARRLAAFVRDPERLARAGTAARDLAHKRFSADLLAERLEGVFLKAVGQEPRTAEAEPSVERGAAS
jgi:glycosyltransferase involved in cell wall biosynthesis